MKRKKLVLLDDINAALDRVIIESGEWAKHEGLAGNSDKAAWHSGASMQARKIRGIVNNEITVCKEVLDENQAEENA